MIGVIYVAKIKAPISCSVTAQLIFAFVFQYAKSWSPHDTVHFIFQLQIVFSLFEFLKKSLRSFLILSSLYCLGVL